MVGCGCENLSTNINGKCITLVTSSTVSCSSFTGSNITSTTPTYALLLDYASKLTFEHSYIWGDSNVTLGLLSGATSDGTGCSLIAKESTSDGVVYTCTISDNYSYFTDERKSYKAQKKGTTLVPIYNEYGQYDFPYPPNLSSSTTVLDQYKEGESVLTASCTSGTVSFYGDAKKIRYTKIGNIVLIRGQVTVQSVSSPTGSLLISGFPFSVGSANAGIGSLSVYTSGLVSGIYSVEAVVNSSGVLKLQAYTSSGLTNLASYVQSGTVFNFSGVL